MSIIDTLITDRTQSDVTRWRTLHDKGWAGMTADEKAEWSAGVKGAYNATDLNRVGEAIEYIADLFGGFGFPMAITPKTDWAIKDIPTSQDLEDYLSNVVAIRSMMSNIPVYPSGWQAPPESPETIQHLTYEQANDIERILTDINDLLVWVSNNLLWLFAGDVYAGEW